MGVKARLARSGCFSDDKQFPPRTGIQKSGECWLWRSVIDRALIDALSTVPSTRKEAMLFFDDKTGWLDKVCIMADLTKQEVLGKLQYFIDTHTKESARKKVNDGK